MPRWLDNRLAVYWSVAIVSGLLSVYRVATRDIINNDGLLYINVARAFLSDGFSSTFEIYQWPFYGILIGLVHKLTGLDLDISADLLNTLLLMLACVVFVRIYEEISDKEARIWIAAILLLALPVLNDYRDFVIRGFGFWTFMLIAMYCFMQYSRTQALGRAFQWQLSIAAAILFRVEGIAFLVFAPLWFLLLPATRRRILVHVVRLNGIFIVLALAVLLIMLVAGGLQLSGMTETPPQLDYVSPMALFDALNTEAEMMYARNEYMSSVDDARLILAAGLLSLVIVEVISNIGLPFLAVLVYGIHRKWLQLSRESFLVLYFAVIGFITLMPVAGNYFFLSSRHTVLIVMLVSLVSFQYADRLFRELSMRRLFKWNNLAWLVVIVLFLDGVISFGASKKNIRNAGEWVAAEMAAAGVRIACNEARLEFYSKDGCEWIMFDDAHPADVINNIVREGYAYLLLWIDRKDNALRQAVEDNPVLILEKEFPGSRGSNVGFYRLIPGER